MKCSPLGFLQTWNEECFGCDGLHRLQQGGWRTCFFTSMMGIPFLVGGIAASCWCIAHASGQVMGGLLGPLGRGNQAWAVGTFVHSQPADATRHGKLCAHRHPTQHLCWGLAAHCQHGCGVAGPQGVLGVWRAALPTLTWYGQQGAALCKSPWRFGDEEGLLGHFYTVKNENTCQALPCEMAPWRTYLKIEQSPFYYGLQDFQLSILGVDYSPFSSMWTAVWYIMLMPS